MENMGDVLKRVLPARGSSPEWEAAIARHQDRKARGEDLSIPQQASVSVAGIVDTYDPLTGRLVGSVIDPYAVLPGETPYWQRHLNKYWTLFKDARITDGPAGFPQTFTTALGLGRGVYIGGPIGTGKTHLLVGEFAALCEGGRLDSALVTATSMMRQIQSDFDRPADQREQERYFSSVQVLLIDDIGRGRPTDWAVGMFGDIIDQRVNRRLLTYCTSNYSIDDLGVYFDNISPMNGERIASRLRQLMVEYVLDGPDRRLA